MNIDQIVGLFTTANIIPFVLGILTSEATRRLIAIGIKAWGDKQVADAAKTPSKDDDAPAKAKQEVASIIADAVAPKKDGQ